MHCSHIWTNATNVGKYETIFTKMRKAIKLFRSYVEDKATKLLLKEMSGKSVS